MSDIQADAAAHAEQIDALAAGKHNTPFAILGIHRSGGQRIVRTLQPQASAVSLIGADGSLLCPMERIHEDGLFAARVPPRIRRYRFRIELPAGKTCEIFLHVASIAFRLTFPKCASKNFTKRRFFRRLFAEGAFSQAFVPVLSEYRTQRSREEVRQLINRTAGSLSIGQALPRAVSDPSRQLSLLSMYSVLTP